MRYTKPPLSLDDQLDLLARRGMKIPDNSRVRHYLAHINYYRLRAYWLPFEDKAVEGDHKFLPGTSFEDALALYVFDRKLRLLILDSIERIEVSLRTRWAYSLAMRYGAHAYLDTGLFRDTEKYRHCFEDLQKEIERSHETFIQHYQMHYTEPKMPPIWAACEVMSLGQLSMWFENLKHHADRKEIALFYQLDEIILSSFMHHLTHVRNLCAHHSRLWNRRFTFTMRLPRKPRHIAGWFNPAELRKIYNTLVMLGYILKIISPDSTWITHIKELLADCPYAKPEAMGFPPGWGQLPLWKDNA
ncbi:MAG: Abi family protein [Gammaproteobacteria bacterium]|nr:Abi family protein [Gammaproteobacteria bacterium]